MNPKTYLFYDIETSGLNKSFDQVLEFAAIRTDLNLNELNRYHYRLKLNPDTIPSPAATITHRISLEDLNSGIPELKAIQEIHQLFNTPNTTSLGYNTLGFDDEFLRFGFYKNLLPPYTHQYANQCQRMDLYPITILYYLFGKPAIKWPMLEGKISLKLENLNALNQWTEGQAHNAMVDVLVTLELAKKLMSDQPMWEYVSGYFDKKIDAERMAQLKPAFSNIDARFKEALLIQGKLGAQNFFQAPVLALGTHQIYKNQSLWLRMDHPDFRELSIESITNEVFVIRKRMAEPPILLPTQTRFLKYLTPERLEIVSSNKAFLSEHPELLKTICDFHQTYAYPEIEGVDLDSALYLRGFPSTQEQALNLEFHRSQDRAKFLNSFSNAEQLQQAIRILGRNHPELLLNPHKTTFDEYLQKVHNSETENAPIDFKGNPRLTIKEALIEIEEILNDRELDEQQKTLLDELKHYLMSLSQPN